MDKEKCYLEVKRPELEKAVKLINQESPDADLVELIYTEVRGTRSGLAEQMRRERNIWRTSQESVLMPESLLQRMKKRVAEIEEKHKREGEG